MEAGRTGGSREWQQGSEGQGQLLLKKITLLSSWRPVEELYISTPPCVSRMTTEDAALWHYWGVEGKALESSTGGAP